MFQYTSICSSCGVGFVWIRKYRLCPSNPHRKLCASCLQRHQAEYNRKPSSRPNRYIDSNGYVNIRLDGKFVAEHRYVMEQILARPLRKGESVHHKDGDKANNAQENLELWLGPMRFGQRASDMICPHCGKSYL